ncbi:MAG TPA: hypothetical protein DIT58_13200 [Porticoccaceae bacterium]|nr:hypothetical protein [Porticoccaceae bacterium]
MTDLDKQTHGSKANADPSVRRRGGSIALKMIADRSLQFFSSQTDELFDHVGDVFFDLAETSEDNEVQSMYFDAIKTVRNERAVVSGRWLNAISSAFDTIGSDSAGWGEVRDVAHPGVDPGGSEREAMLLLDNMVAASANTCRATLVSLQQRFSRLVGENISVQGLPLSPERLSVQFVDALSDCRLDNQAKLVLLDSYERQVLATLPELLGQCDQLLQSLGIETADETKRISEPEVPIDAERTAMGDRGFEPAGQSGAGRESAHAVEVAADMQRGDAFGRIASPPKLPKSGKTRDKSNLVTPLGGALLIDRPALCELLERVAEGQRGFIQCDGVDPNAAAGDQAQQAEPIELTVSQLLTKEAGSTFALNESDQAIIDLVDTLYVLLVEEMALPQYLLKLLMRTALPFARVALAEPSMLEVDYHPARRLVAEIVQCIEELRGSENIETDRLYQSLVAAVQRFERCPLSARELSRVFVELVRDVESEREIARSAEAILLLDANERETVNTARRRVEELLELRLLGKQFGYAIVVFVERVWAGVLYNAVTTAGLESEQWLGAVHLLDQLLGLESQADVDPELIDRILGAMAAILVEEGQEAQDISQWQDRISQYLLRGKLRPENIHPLMLEKTDAQEADDYDLRVLVEIVETNLPGEFDQEFRELAAKVNDTALAEIDSLKKGCWVKAESPNARTQQYWRFVGTVGASENFLFSDRRRQKMFLASRSSLAVKLKHGELTVLDSAQRFERNLSRVLLEQGTGGRRFQRRGESADLRRAWN